MKLSVLVGVLVEFERAKAQQFFDDVIWTMPVIKNQTLEAKIETLKKQQEKDGFFGKEKYMEDYYKEIATGKKTTIHQNLESLKSEEEVTKKLDERKHRWLEDTKLMWKDLCHMNFELLNAKDQQAVVDFCPKADKCFIPMKNNVKYPNGEKDHIGQPKTPARPREISKTEVINDFVECIQYRCECPDYQENGWPVGKEVRGEKKYSVAGESLGYSKCWLFARRIGWRFQENVLKK